MVRSLRNGLLAMALLGGIGVASLPAQAMPVGDLAKAAVPGPAGETAPIVQARWHWHRPHWRWHRHRGWHRHWGWHHPRWGWRHRHRW